MEDCCDDGCGCTVAPLSRRTFLTLSTLGLAGASMAEPLVRSDAPPADHFVPTDKKLRPEWVKTLFAKGERKVYRGGELQTIGMPCGGIAAGQLYVRGDGTLSYWWMMNNAHHSSFGGQTKIATEWGDYGVCYGTYAPPKPLEQGFLLRLGPQSTELSEAGFDDIGFIGEYPVATVLYNRKKLPALPVTIQSQVFSPFIPLNTKDTALPTTILRFTVTNTSDRPQPVALVGYLQNPVFQPLRETVVARSRNRVVRVGGITAVVMDAVEAPAAPKPAPVTELFDDFEKGYGKWTLTGDCWGTEPPKGTLPNQQNVSGFTGESLVNTYVKGDVSTGKAVSQSFTITQPYIAFLIGGGSDRENLGLRLVVEGKVVRQAAGHDNERLEPAFWEVQEWGGKTAHLEIVDSATGPWGHINVDQITFTNTPPVSADVFSRQHPLYGSVALAALVPDAGASAVLNDNQSTATVPLKEELTGAVEQSATLAPGEERVFTFVLSWFFPNRQQREDEANGPGGRVGASGPRVGQKYATWFSSALEVAEYVAQNQARLIDETLLFRDTLYDTTLPYWLVQRCSMPLANMATEVYQWWESGRVWCWEGVGCCTGNCGHVYNYAQGPARLFPELERSVRHFQDFAPGHGLSATGAIGFRGLGDFWAGDAQGGYILKAYREHLCSPDSAFLKEHWPQIKKALQFLMGQDENGDGLIEGRQHNTYDIDFYGPNTMVGSLYLGALKAGAAMARLQGEGEFAERCDTLAKAGAEATQKRLYNGEYFIQEVDLKKHPKHQYGDGCLSDQLLGQWFAHQLDLGYVYPPETVKSALSSVFKYNWAPDIGPQTKAHHPDRDFAKPGEAGLFTCTWPKSKHLGPESVLYRDEIWSGIEYQVAAHLLMEGLTTEALAVVRGIHERYDGTKHNPFNEIECGDHYARALASWSVLLAASGFIGDGPAGRLGFAPKLAPANFKGLFTTAEGWGSYRQSGSEREVAVKWGQVRLTELVFEDEKATGATITVEGKTLPATVVRRGKRVVLQLSEPIVLKKSQVLLVHLA